MSRGLLIRQPDAWAITLAKKNLAAESLQFWRRNFEVSKLDLVLEITDISLFTG
jgi:hypothetical protein